MKAVIQSGGQGMRLRPYTMVLPKPLMPVGSKPVLELLLRWLRRNGVRHTYITTGHLGHLIRSYCGDGGQWDLQIDYTEEAEPLGTIGALSLLRQELDSTFLMLNGDILTDLSLNEFTAAHRRHGAALTVATTDRTVPVAFGVIEESEGWVTQFREKPKVTHCVSTGVYCMEPCVLDYIPCNIPFGFDDLIYALLGKGIPVRTFAHDGVWLDIGSVDDFRKAQDFSWEDPPARAMAPRGFDSVITS